MTRKWSEERKQIDAATTPAVRLAWVAEPITVEQVCAIARDMFETYSDQPTDEQAARLATVLAQIPPVYLRHDASRPAASYRVIGMQTRVEYEREHPEFPYANADGGPPVGSGITTADARSCDAVLILIGKRGGASMLHVNHPDLPYVACHITGNKHQKRVWYSRPQPATPSDEWRRI